MKIVAVDDENLALYGLTKAIREAVPTAELHSFEYPEDALAYVRENGCEVAFLDIEMAEMSGVELARLLKEVNPRINIIFTTGFEQYRKEAFELYASGYVTKPIRAERIKQELENLRYELPQVKENEEKQEQVRLKGKNKGLRIQALGSFEVFYNEKIVSFKYSKTKELFAYLIDRKGALCTNAEIIAVLWGDNHNHDNYFRNLRKDLMDTLKAIDCDDVIIRQVGKQGVVADLINCDYYEWLAGKKEGEVWQGEYMAQYNWR